MKMKVACAKGSKLLSDEYEEKGRDGTGFGTGRNLYMDFVLQSR
jgi:hypothetical protein